MSLHHHAKKRGLLAASAAFAAVAALILSGCSTTTDTPSATESAGAVPADVSAAVAAAYEGTSGPLPAESPEVSAGHDVWIVSAFQMVPGLAYLAEQLSAATDTLGWDSEICDGQNNANSGWGNCIRQGVAAGADSIVLLSVDCAPVKQALAEAKAAGIAIAGISSFDCDDPSQGASEAMFDTEVQYGDGIDGVADFFEWSGRLRADYIIEQTGGNAKVLHVAFEGVAIGDYLSKGFEEELAEKCPDCEIVNTVSITPADIAQMRQKFETGLLQATDANAIVVDLGFMLAGGIQQSIVSNNAADGRVVLGGECTQDEIGYIHDGDGIQACIAISNGRAAWSLADQLNRFFNGQGAVKDGIGWTLLDAESPNLPPAGENYDGPLDYRSGYAELWGLS